MSLVEACADSQKNLNGRLSPQVSFLQPPTKLRQSLLLLPRRNSELNGNEEKVNRRNPQLTRRHRYLLVGKLGKEMGRGVKSGYRPIRIKRLEVDSNLLLEVSDRRPVMARLSSTEMATAMLMGMLVYHYQDKRVELPNEDHHPPGRLYYRLQHPTRPSHLNRLYDSVMVR
jgi:hypothetical protein